MWGVRSIQRKVYECDGKCARMNEDLKTTQKNEERLDEILKREVEEGAE